MKIYVTGISGTGKTSIAHLLKQRGIYSVSIDEAPNLCYWINKVTHKKVDYEAKLDSEFISSHEWMCDTNRLRELIDINEKTIVVLGLAENQNNFLHFFDKVLLLQCKPETFMSRIMQRTDNDFGKDESAQKLILSSYTKFEDELLDKGAISINVEQPLEKVVDEIISISA